MAYVMVNLSKPLNWLIDVHDPEYVGIPYLPGFQLLNPVKAHFFNRQRRSPMGKLRTTWVSRIEDKILIGQPFLCLKYDPSFPEEHVDHAIAQLLDAISVTVKFKKDAFAMGFEVSYVENFYGADITYDDADVTQGFRDKGWVEERIIDRALTFRDVAVSEPPQYDQPIYHSVLLDAIRLFTEKEYTKALLYLGMACEIGFNYHRDAIVQQHLENHRKGIATRMNFVEHFDKKAKKTLYKDPIFESLRKNFSSTFVNQLLYVDGRNIEKEQPRLYNDVLRLYSTRNEIAHKGVVTDYASTYKPNTAELAEAFAVVRDFFAWLGVDADFPIPGKDGWSKKPYGYSQQELEFIHKILD